MFHLTLEDQNTATENENSAMKRSDLSPLPLPLNAIRAHLGLPIQFRAEGGEGDTSVPATKGETLMAATLEMMLDEASLGHEPESEDQSETPRADFALAHGRILDLDRRRSILRVSSSGGEVELQIRITPEGPVLVFDQARVSIQNSGNIDLECEDLDIRARGRLMLESGGDSSHRVAGNYTVDVRDDAEIKAQAVDVHAQLGELSLRANDDVALNGLRVLLNAPTQEEIEERRRAVQSFKDVLELPVVAKGAPRRLPKTPPKRRGEW